MKREPRVCIWEITAACNLQCVHCDNHATRPTPRELTLPQLLATAEQLPGLGCRLVDITGGEPLLTPNWDRLSRHLTNRGIEVALITNGTLLDGAVVERAVAAGLSMVAVSIDGLRATHDATRRFAQGAGSAFDAAVAGLRLAQAHFPVSVITQVNRTNLGELRDLGRMLGGLSVSRWQLQLAVPTARVASLPIPYVIAPGDLERLTDFIVAAAEDPSIPMIYTSDNIGYGTPAEAILRRKASGPGLWLGCSAGMRAVAIKFDGTVRGCSLLPSEFSAGDLHDETLTSIWNDHSRFAYSTAFARSDLSGGCERCRFGSICRAGCTTMAYFATGTIGDNPYCLRRVREQTACCT